MILFQSRDNQKKKKYSKQGKIHLTPRGLKWVTHAPKPIVATPSAEIVSNYYNSVFLNFVSVFLHI